MHCTVTFSFYNVKESGNLSLHILCRVSVNEIEIMQYLYSLLRHGSVTGWRGSTGRMVTYSTWLLNSHCFIFNSVRFKNWPLLNNILSLTQTTIYLKTVIPQASNQTIIGQLSPKSNFSSAGQKLVDICKN